LSIIDRRDPLTSEDAQMPRNPFPTRKDWQAEKTKFGIPDGIIKTGSFGEKMEKLGKAYDARGGKNPDIKSVASIVEVLENGQALAGDWLKKARAMKPAQFKDRNKAIAAVEHYQELFEQTASRVQLAVDPLREARTNIKKAMTIYRNAVANPADEALLSKLWDPAARQLVGQGFRLALVNADKIGYSAAVKKHLQDYDDLMDKWMNTMITGVEKKKMVADATRRKEFMDDMGKAFATATSALAATAP